MSQLFRSRTRSSQCAISYLLEENSEALFSVARRYSLCRDDANDAYQRAIEIYLRRADSLDRERVGGWLKTVIKHEALAIRKERSGSLTRTEFNPDTEEARHLLTLDERVVGSETTTRSMLALTKLKQDELKALKLKAEGYTYEQISELTGWTYTKVNRCLTEGRQRFRSVVEAIESGEECRSWRLEIAALADGEPLEQQRELFLHMKGCVACRSSLRAHRRMQRRIGAALMLPRVEMLLPNSSSGTEPFLVGLHAKVPMLVHKAQALIEGFSWSKATAVVLSASTLLGGGAALIRSDNHHNNRHSIVDRSAVRNIPNDNVAIPREAVSREHRRTAGVGQIADSRKPIENEEFSPSSVAPKGRKRASRSKDRVSSHKHVSRHTGEFDI